MAISKTLKLRIGLVAESAYIRVDSYYGSKDLVTFSANIYLSEEAFKGTEHSPAEPFLQQNIYEFRPDSSPEAAPILQQCYDHLLKQEDFIKAIAA